MYLIEYLFGIFYKSAKKADITYENPPNVEVLLQGNLIGFDTTPKAKDHIKEIYTKHGIRFLGNNLNGSFNIVIIDERSSKINILTDKYGSRPLFIYEDENKYIYSSKIKDIIDNLSAVKINWEGIAQYLAFRFTLGENTFFENIKLIDNASIHVIDLADGNIKKFKYWTYDNLNVDKSKSFDAKVAEGKEVFEDVFRSLSKDLKNKPFVLGLSAGYDSRAIAAGLRNFGKMRFDTLTTLHPCGPEGEIVKNLTNTLGINNTYVERPKDIYRKYYLKKAQLTDYLVQEHLWSLPMVPYIKVYDYYVDGVAGDIIMRSTRVRPIHVEKYDDNLFLSKLFKKQFGFEYEWLKKYVDRDIWNKIKYDIEWIREEFNKIQDTELKMDIFLMKNRVRNGISIASNNAIGEFVDNVYQPFFDSRVLEFGMTLPHEYKFDFIYRKILDHTYPNIKHIPSSSDETKEKLLKYDKRIVQFNKNPRELVSEYSNVSEDDTLFLENLLEQVEDTPIIDKKHFIEDYRKDRKLNRLTTVLDLSIWWNSILGEGII